MRPIEDLEAATERIRQGRFDKHVPVTTGDELGELGDAFNQMVDGLAEREKLREAFGTYLDEEVAGTSSARVRPRGRRGRGLDPLLRRRALHRVRRRRRGPEIVACLNELFEAVVPIIARQRGHVDKFIGDGLMAVFGAPERIEDHADRAVQARSRSPRTVNGRRRAASGRDRRQLGQRRRRVDRRRRAAQLQRDRRRGQPRLPGRGAHPRARRRGADHRRDAQPARARRSRSSPAARRS